MALALGLSTFAQTWTAISQDVTGTNFLNSSETISTAAIRAEGKAMVIDFSATWCSWCWVMHQAGILEAIHDQLGSQVEVIWVEADPSTTNPAEITGSGSTQGDWTNGGTVPYPIINDHNFANIIGGTSAISGYPTVVFVSPSGYWCDVYGTDWGFGPYSATDAVAAVSALLTSYPQPNTPPTVSISGFANVLNGSTATFTANIMSVDPVSSIEWDFVDGTPATATSTLSNPTATTTWNTTGPRTITCTVTNTTGSTTASFDVNVFEWNWGDEISYCGTGAFQSSIGFGGTGEIQWGIKIPSEHLTGRNFLTNVGAYIYNPGTYEVIVYQGATPTTTIYQATYNVTVDDQWFDFEVYGGAAINPDQDLWVTFHTNGVSYPAAYTPFVGDPNGSYLLYNGTWTPVYEVSASLQATWMITATTSSEAPALNTAINGPSNLTLGSVGEFFAYGPADATYEWTLTGANPATATGQNVSASWDTPGTYTISVTATKNSETATDSRQVVVVDCDATAPYTMGFESNESVNCMTLIDNDGDGNGWEISDYSHNGEAAMASASYINGVGALAPDNWMITPKITIPAGSAYFSWWSGARDNTYHYDHYAVLISTTGNSMSDFTTTLFEGDNQAGAFRRHSVSLDSYAGQNVYIAFRHYNCQDVYQLQIDDISLSTGVDGIDDVDNDMVSVSPNPTTDRVVVKAENLQTVEVYDMTGALVLTTDRSVVDMTAFSNGVYMFRVSTLNGVSNQKVVKQ